MLLTDDPFSLLPPELCWLIFSSLDLASFKAARSCCKIWNKVTDRQPFWSLFFHNTLSQKKIALGVNQEHFTLKQVVLSFKYFPSIQAALDDLSLLQADDPTKHHTRCVYLGFGLYEESFKIDSNATIIGYSPSFSSPALLSLSSLLCIPSPKRHRRIWKLPVIRPTPPVNGNPNGSNPPGSLRVPVTCSGSDVRLKSLRVESEEECMRVKGGKINVDGCLFTSIDGKPGDGVLVEEEAFGPLSSSLSSSLSLSGSMPSLSGSISCPNLLSSSWPMTSSSHSSFSHSSSFSFSSSFSSSPTVRRSSEPKKYKPNYLVVIEGEGEAEIRRCRFFDGTLGVFASGLSMVAADNLFQNLQWGMVVATKQKSYIENNQSMDCRTGLLIQSSSSALVQSNQFHHNVIGLSILSSASAVVEGNQIFQNSASGVYLQANSSAVIKSTSIFENKEKGIIAFDRCHVTVEDSVVQGNGQSGICLEEDSSGVVKNNKVLHNKWGISLLNSSSLEIVSNEIHSNQIRGVSVQDSSKATIRANQVYKNAEGIVGTHESRLMVAKNRIHSNKNIGLSLRDQSFASVAECQVCENSRGVTLMNKSVAELIENEICNNIRCGVSVRDGSEAKMTNNHFHGNKDLESDLNDQVKACGDKGVCTFAVTGKSFVEQNWFNCQTCFPGEDNSGVCEVCARKCHVGHKLSPVKYTSFYCDCGAKENEEGVKNKFCCLCPSEDV